MVRSSAEGSPAQKNTPPLLNSMQLSGAMARETVIISSVALLEPQVVTIDSDSIEPAIPYGFGNQHPIVTPSLKDNKLPPNPFNVLATMIRADEEYRPQSPETSIPSPFSTPPGNVSTIEGWETTQKSTNVASFYTDDKPRRVCSDYSSDETFDSNEPRYVFIASSPSSTPPPPRGQKRKLSMGICFPNTVGVSQHTCKACG